MDKSTSAMRDSSQDRTDCAWTILDVHIFHLYQKFACGDGGGFSDRRPWFAYIRNFYSGQNFFPRSRYNFSTPNKRDVSYPVWDGVLNSQANNYTWISRGVKRIEKF
jgi:hypothetical protein